MFECPCCRNRTLSELAGFEICDVCGWEDDGQNDATANEVWGGPNKGLSLSQARQNYLEFGASDKNRLEAVRKPTKSETAK